MDWQKVRKKMVEVVIKISDAIWNKAKEYGHLDICGIELSEIVMNGIPLPKGHGRLKDIDRIEELLDLKRPNNVIAENIKNIIDSVPTIVEKDYSSLEEEYLGNPVAKTGVYADYEEPGTVSMIETN